MKIYKFFRLFLIIISVVLCIGLFHPLLSSFSPQEAGAEGTAQDIAFGSRTGSSITCSSDGRYVYATDGSSIYRSLNYGKNGSWEEVAR